MDIFEETYKHVFISEPEEATKDRTKAALSRLFQKQHFRDRKDGKTNLNQLNSKKQIEFFYEQKKRIEDKFISLKGTLETIAKECGQEIADRICHIFIISSDEIKQKGGYIRHKNYYISICERHKLNYIADKLKKL